MHKKKIEECHVMLYRERIFTATGSGDANSNGGTRSNAVQSDLEGGTRNTAIGSSAAKPDDNTRNTASGSSAAKPEGRAGSTATQSDYAKPDGETRSIATDKPDCGVYVHVNVYALN